ncbi:alpha/beta fold hydrolase [Mycolicibacterium sp.]|uniref:alpha/beta fold hydrolase n=1 Tax=Mycolicibacterium sp. TaxID=2320850 RepID=UPI0037CB93F9
MRRTTVTARDGVQLAVTEYGTATAERTVILLHGLCLTQQAWEPQTRFLQTEFGDTLRAVTYDHRGHGRSGTADMRTYTVEQLADDLDTVITALGLSNVTVVGHSMGAMAALVHCAGAREPHTAPQRLVAIATAAGRIAQRGLGRLLGTPATSTFYHLAGHAPQRAVRALAGPLCTILTGYQRWPAAERAALAALSAAAMTTTPLSTTAGFLTALRTFDTYAHLSAITIPTTILSGGADLLTPADHADDLAAAIPGATHIHIPGAGHMLPHEQPAVVNHVIAEALSARSQPAAVSA